MYVQDPQEWWSGGPGYIENLEIDIQPIGTHAEIALTFDVATDEDFFNPESQLEFVFEFPMPNDVVFNDSWLWIEEYVSEGVIYEKNDGTQIYEGIVSRRQDPSILTKSSKDNYNLKIYPLFADSTRKVKISYIQPFYYEGQQALINLPNEIFSSSFREIESVNLNIKNSNEWGHDRISHPNIEYVTTQDGIDKYIINALDTRSTDIVSFTSQDISVPYYFSTYEQDGDQYFQMAIFQNRFDIERPAQNLLFVLDYQSGYSTIGIDALLNTLEGRLKNELTADDNFNICFQDFRTTFSSDTWLSATQENIEMAIAAVRDGGMDEYTSLVSTIPAAVDFVSMNDKNAEIILISNDRDFDDTGRINDFIEELESFYDTMDEEITISILDYSDLYRRTHWVNGIVYEGNGYIYSRLANLFDGLYTPLDQASELGSELYNTILGTTFNINAFDIDLDPTNGLIYDDYFNFSNTNNLSLNQPIIGTGKYLGSFPFTFDLKAKIGNDVLSQEYTITEDNSSNESFTPTIWAAQYLLDNEFDNDPNIINDVIELSMDERLLCFRTIFLSLEEGFVPNDDPDFDNEGGPVTVSNDEINEVNITVYPNPFIEKLSIQLPLSIDTEDLSVELINSEGRLIRTINVTESHSDAGTILEWKNDSNLLSGLYTIRIITKDNIYQEKVIHISK